ncbi:MAG: DUF1579 domain-containing protein [Pirellulaceae bacterium]
MFAKPQSEHEWLHQLVGNWDVHHACQMPDGSQSTTTGKMICRSLGGMWLLCEGSGSSPDEGEWSSVMTLGFDPVKSKYVGTFVGSMMANIWNYEGEREADSNRVPLSTIGPKFDGSGTCNYRDTLEIVDANTWRLSSEMQNDDGTWVQFMDGKHHRI